MAWTELAPAAPAYLFVPQDADLLAEYERGWSLCDVFAPNGDPAPGIVTTHDEFAISWTPEEAVEKVERLLATQTEAEARGLFKLCSQDQWQYMRARRELADGKWREKIVPILYRPFDVRWTVYDRNVAVHRRERASDHLLKNNLALLTTKQTKDEWSVFVSDTIAAHKSGSVYDITSVVPLWRYPRESADLLDSTPRTKTANLSPEFVAALTAAVGMAPSPDDTLAYIYAILYTPSYRARYADFLKRDFPRVPLTTNRKLFDALVATGRELIALHTMQTTLPRISGYPIAGGNEVVKVRFIPPSERRGSRAARGDGEAPGESHPPRSPFLRKGEENHGCVWINDAQYFDGVPESVWDMHVGGYRVAEKWLKDRKGRLLSFDDIEHYQHVIAALARTLALQVELDAFVMRSGGWPLH
jgi:hypothetical protein